MNKVLYLCVFVFVLTVSGCVEKTQLPALLNSSVVEGMEMSFVEDYGAAYLWDELRVEADFAGADDGFLTTYTLNQALEIFDRSGVKYGTVEIRRYEGVIDQFDLRLVNGRGRELPLDQEALKEQYLDTGKIVFPQIQPGCRIYVNMVIRSSKPLSSFDYLYNKNIPVLKSRFSFLHDNSFSYKSKTYELDSGAEPISAHFMNGFMIESEKIKPIDTLQDNRLQFLMDNLDYSDLARTHLQLDKFWTYSTNWAAPEWSAIAGDFVNNYHSTSIFSNSDEMKNMAEWLIRHESTDFDKADAILEYIQNNFTVTDGKNISSSVNLGEVWQSKSGNIVDISVLLSEMLRSAGLETHHYVTRAPGAGGFDPEMPSWSQLHTPLVSVIAEGKELIAFPYVQGFRLGEYPFQFDGSYALQLETGKAVLLPEASYNSARIASSVDLSLSSPDTKEHIWRYQLADHFAASTRGFFKKVSQYDLHRIGTSILQMYSDQHRLENVQRDTINRNIGVNLDLKFSNETLSVKHDSGRMMTLKPFFRTFFTDTVLGKDRKFENDLEIVFEEEIYLMDFVKNSGQLMFACEDMDNRMFKVECSEEIYEHDATVGRTVTVKKTELSPEELRQLLPDVRMLNSITESYVTFKN